MKNLFTRDTFGEIFENSAKHDKNAFLRTAALNQQSLEKFESGSNHTTAAYDSASFPVSHQNEYRIQQIIRPLFNKSGINTTSIAGHPDFVTLSQSDIGKYHYICPLFIDIKGSTRLSLLYDLPFIHQFKNAVIQTCIELIRSFDGYVHRIMGDAVLGFFGSSTMSKEQAALDAVNCAAMLKVMLEQTIRPWLQQEKPDFDARHFGFRIGCNFGDTDEVYWANYGYGEVGEISPTGLPIDLAAKLQAHASKNETMLGQGLLEFFNWPEEFTKVKTKKRDGNEVSVPFITPDYLKKDGKALQYTMRLLAHDKYIRGLPLPINSKTALCNGYLIDHPAIRLSIETHRPNGQYRTYTSNTEIIPKYSGIRIKLGILNESHLLPAQVIFIKQNYSGFQNEAVLEQHLDEEREVYNLRYKIDNRFNHHNTIEAVFERECIFRGIHSVTCEVRNQLNQVIFREVIFVPIA